MLIYILKVMVSSFAFWLIYHTLLHKDTFFERNRLYLMAATIGSFLLPLADWQAILAFNSSGLTFAPTQLLREIEIGQELVVAGFDWLLFTQILILVVTGCYFIYVAAGIWQLNSLVKRNSKEVHPDYTLVKLENGQYPFSFMNYLFWSDTHSFSMQEKEKIIQHELAHIRGKHSYDIIFMEIACGLCWFNPVFFFFKKYLKEQHEYIADAFVYQQGGKSNYAKLIVQNTLKSLDMAGEFIQPKIIHLSHNFYQSPILKRLEMMNKKRTPSVKSLKLLFVVPVVAMLGFLYSCDTVENSESVVEDIEKKVQLDKVFDEVDQMAQPEGGMTGLYQFLAANIKYPDQAKRLGVEGKVFVQIIINKDGSIESVEAIKGIGAGCDAEAVRVVKDLPNWSPAILDGKNVKQKLVLPVSFKLK